MSSWSKLRGPWPAVPVAVRLLIVAAGSGLVLFFTPVGAFLSDIPLGQVKWLLEAREDGFGREAARLRALGKDYQVVAFLKERTPEDAIILLPDPDLPGPLDRLKARNVRWMTYFLYPRRLLHTYEQDVAYFRDARWVLLDSPESAYWVPPEIRPSFEAGDVHCIHLNVGALVDAIEHGQISPRYRPPSTPIASGGGR